MFFEGKSFGGHEVEYKSSPLFEHITEAKEINVFICKLQKLSFYKVQ